jgi:uncharacterized Zn-finger protein
MRKENKMKEKTVTINQCQDCGCPGNQIELYIPREHRGMSKSPAYFFVCPYCKRRSQSVKVFGVVQPETILMALVTSWNSINREYKEGLA